MSFLILKVVMTSRLNIHIDTLCMYVKTIPRAMFVLRAGDFVERVDFYSKGAGKIRLAKPSFTAPALGVKQTRLRLW